MRCVAGALRLGRLPRAPDQGPPIDARCWCSCAGASWSGIDYGGVWKPVQFSIARAFADVSLNVQHDLKDGRITVGCGRVCNCTA
jgi:hypothetical protein